MRSLTFLTPWLLFGAPLLAETVIQVPADADLQTAISLVDEGGAIEIATGTYTAPADGFAINDVNKNFTIRAASNATVVLSGAGNRRVLRLVNTTAGLYSVTFENLIFADGESTLDGFGGGVTLSRADATFIGCEFRDNTSIAPNTGGGGVFMFDQSSAHFYSCRFDGNTAQNEGGGLRVGTGTVAYVHDSELVANRTNVADHRPSAPGGAIHVTNAQLRVANTRFEANEAGCNAGAVYALGSWQDPVSVPAAEVWIANSTFVNNKVEPHPTVTCSFTPSGGAVHAEDQTTLRIFHSRFEGNNAEIGGAVTQYRSIVEIDDSVFRGNFATGTGTSGFGGAIMSNSNDAVDTTTDNGAINRRSASLAIRDSYFQSRFGGTTFGALTGGCVFVLGDTNRTFGIGAVPQMGDGTVNRAQVTVERSLFHDCDAIEEAGVTGTGAGGALSLGHTTLTLTDSLIAGSDAVGSVSAGGGMRVVTDSTATVTGTTFAHNTAGNRAGAIQVSGSRLDVDDSRFFGNQVTDGSPGSAIWSATLINFQGVDVDTTGLVQNSVFSDSTARFIQEFDNSGGPINDLRYNANQFFTEPVDSIVYGNTVAGVHDVGSLNALVVTRNAGVGNTDKSTVANLVLTSEPQLGAILAAPPEILLTHAAFDPPPPSTTFIGYAWSAASGTTVELFGQPVPAAFGVETAGSGVHELTVGAETFLTAATNAAVPAVDFAADPQAISSGQSSNLEWTATGGTFLDLAIDQRVVIAAAPSGSVSVSPPATTDYQLCLLTEEGGVRATTTVFVDELPGQIFADGFESGNTSAWN